MKVEYTIAEEITQLEQRLLALRKALRALSDIDAPEPKPQHLAPYKHSPIKRADRPNILWGLMKPGVGYLAHELYSLVEGKWSRASNWAVVTSLVFEGRIKATGKHKNKLTYTRVEEGGE